MPQSPVHLSPHRQEYEELAEFARARNTIPPPYVAIYDRDIDRSGYDLCNTWMAVQRNAKKAQAIEKASSKAPVKRKKPKCYKWMQKGTKASRAEASGPKRNMCTTPYHRLASFTKGPRVQLLGVLNTQASEPMVQDISCTAINTGTTPQRQQELRGCHHLQLHR